MTARKPVSALALGLSSAVVFGFGAGQASADVNQVVPHRLISLQSDPTPSPVLALSAILTKADTAAVLKQLKGAAQIRFALILQKLPNLSKLDQSKLAELAKTDPAKAQAAIISILIKLPNLSRAQATVSAALLAAIMCKSSNLSKLDISSLPDLAALDQSQAHAAIDSIVSKLPDASNLTKEDVAQILLAIQKVDLSTDSGVSAGVDLSKPSGLAGLGEEQIDVIAGAIVAKSPDLSKADVVQVLSACGKLDLSKVSGVPAGVDLSKPSGLAGLGEEQIDVIAGAIAAQAQTQSQSQAQSQSQGQGQTQGQQAAALSEADLAAAQDALAKIDPASLPDLSKVDLSKLGAPSL
jgi:hypothetical protein